MLRLFISTASGAIFCTSLAGHFQAFLWADKSLIGPASNSFTFTSHDLEILLRSGAVSKRKEYDDNPNSFCSHFHRTIRTYIGTQIIRDIVRVFGDSGTRTFFSGRFVY